jgi:hypothetical protein
MDEKLCTLLLCQSTHFTREGSQVRSLHRPPFLPMYINSLEVTRRCPGGRRNGEVTRRQQQEWFGDPFTWPAIPTSHPNARRQKLRVRRIVRAENRRYSASRKIVPAPISAGDIRAIAPIAARWKGSRSAGSRPRHSRDEVFWIGHERAHPVAQPYTGRP